MAVHKMVGKAHAARMAVAVLGVTLWCAGAVYAVPASPSGGPADGTSEVASTNQVITLTLDTDHSSNGSNGSSSDSGAAGNPFSGADQAPSGGVVDPASSVPGQLPPPEFGRLSVVAIGSINQDGAQIVRRAGPSSMQVLFTCSSGQVVGIAGQIGNWYCILMADQTLGCIPTERVTLTWLRPGNVPDLPDDRRPSRGTVPGVVFPDYPRNNGGSPAGMRVVDNAMRYLGVRYRWGGNTAGGIDCSGLVKAAFNREGIDLPRTAREQSGVGMRVSLAEIEPGDRLSFACHGATIDHTGIYIGSGQFIHASGSKGEVCITSLDSYLKFLAGIHRDFRS